MIKKVEERNIKRVKSAHEQPSDISTISVNRHEKMGNCGNQHQQKVVVKGGFFLPYKPSTTLNKFSLNVKYFYTLLLVW